jgi:hypothetical protein
MAVATAIPTVLSDNQIWTAGTMMHVLGSIALQASPATYVTGGLTLNFNVALIKAQRVPQRVNIWSQNGYIYSYVPGTDNTNGTMKIFTAIGTELGNGVAIPAGNSGDTITFEGIWLGQN